MSRKTIRAGQWLITEGSVSGNIIYKLIKGRVSIYEGGKRINAIEVEEGMKPRLIGVISALTSDRVRTASVRTDTDIDVETVYIDHFKGLLKHDVPAEMKDDIDAIIKSIVVRDKIKRLQRELSEIAPPEKLGIPDNLNQEVSEVLSELMEVYESSRYFY